MPTRDCIGKKLSLAIVVVGGDTVVEVATGSAGGGGGGGGAVGLSSSPLEAGT
jgi:hypothetical protein